VVQALALTDIEMPAYGGSLPHPTMLCSGVSSLVAAMVPATWMYMRLTMSQRKAVTRAMATAVPVGLKGRKVRDAT
jgi:hypothetical protein